jgi:hypothetical protein
MTERWSDFDETEKETIEDVATALSMRESFVRGSARAGADEIKVVAFQDLYAYVNDPDAAPGPEFFESLAANPQMQRTLSGLIEQGAMCRFDLARVASTGRVDRREEAEFSVHTQESHASPGRTILAITIQVARDVNPRWLFVEAKDGQRHKHELPEAQGDQIQFMIPTDLALVQALREANARVTLR